MGRKSKKVIDNIEADQVIDETPDETPDGRNTKSERRYYKNSTNET